MRGTPRGLNDHSGRSSGSFDEIGTHQIEDRGTANQLRGCPTSAEDPGWDARLTECRQTLLFAGGSFSLTRCDNHAVP